MHRVHLSSFLLRGTSHIAPGHWANIIPVIFLSDPGGVRSPELLIVLQRLFQRQYRRISATRSYHSYDLVADMDCCSAQQGRITVTTLFADMDYCSAQQGRITVTTLLQTRIFDQCNKVVSQLRPCCRHGFLLSATRSYHSYDLVADMDFCSVQQGRITVTTLLQTWIFAQRTKVVSQLRPCCRHGFLLSATRSYHSYDLVADMDFCSVQQGRISYRGHRQENMFKLPQMKTDSTGSLWQVLWSAGKQNISINNFKNAEFPRREHANLPHCNHGHDKFTLNWRMLTKP